MASVGRIDALGVRPLVGAGSALAGLGGAAIAVAPTLAVFLAAHLLVGLAFACLLSAGFAGVAAFPPERRPWAIGYVAGANALAWIVVNPISGALVGLLARRRLVASSALIMAILLPVLLTFTASVVPAAATFCLLGLAAGIRSPAASALGLEQLPGHPGAMMAARTAAAQLGYLLGAVAGGAVISRGGFSPGSGG